MCCSYCFEMGLSSFNCEVIIFRILPKCSHIVVNCHFNTEVWILSLSEVLNVGFK